MSRTTISLDPETRDRLKELGQKGETYDELVNRLIDVYLNAREAQEAAEEGGDEADVTFERLS